MDSAPSFASPLRMPTGACEDICVVPVRLNWHGLLGGRPKGERGGTLVTHAASGIPCTGVAGSPSGRTQWPDVAAYSWGPQLATQYRLAVGN